MKLIALKRMHYPSGPSGRDYQAGETFETVSDRDAKALKLVRAAKDAPGPMQRRKIVDLPPEAMKAVTPSQPSPPPAPAPTEPEVPVPGRSYYQRRNMTAEE